VQAGERIRFEINAGRRGYVAIVGIDGAGAQTVYFPFQGTQPVCDRSGGRPDPSRRGQARRDTGDETFYALYSEQPFSFDVVLPALHANGCLPG